MSADLDWLHDQTRIIALVNNKGGVGKTTLATNVAGLLGLSGWRCLVVDLDHQGNAGLDLGYRGSAVDDDGQALFKALVLGEPITPVNVRPNVDVIIGGSLLEEAQRNLVPSARRAQPRLAVAEMLESVLRTHEYDIVLLDCPPSSDIIQTAAVTAANYVLIPVKTDRASLEGLALTAKRLDAVIDLNPNVDLLGIVIFDSGTGASRIRKDNVERIIDAVTGGSDNQDIRKRAAASIFTAFIRHAEKTAQSTRDEGLLVHELDEKVKAGPKWFERVRTGDKAAQTLPESAGPVADDLQAVTKELVERITAREAVGEEAVNV